MAETTSPYLGLLPYEQQHRSIFFGRETEIRTLKSLLVSHSMVLLHAQSGTGKTSLINAGLIPLLADDGLEVLPPTRVRGAIPEGMSPEKIRNLYIFNAIIGWIEREPVHPVGLQKLTLAEFLQMREHQPDEEGQPSLRVVIFDQLEELLTFYPERWQERENFFAQIARALEIDPLLRVLLVMREDYVGSIDPYMKFFPEAPLVRFRLEALREEAALEAVTGPLAGTGRSFAPGVAEELVGNLLKSKVETATGATDIIAGEFVEPVQLQVVCKLLWEELEADTITHEHLKVFGDVDQALQRFYDESIRATAAESGVSETELREWIQNKLITSGNTRGSVWQGEGIDIKAVVRLEDLHIIRGDWRTGSRWYELIHDRIIDPILRSNEIWFSERWEKIQTGKRLEASAQLWISNEKGNTGLLEEVELVAAENWLLSLTAKDRGCSEEIRAFLDASRASVEAEKIRRELDRKKELEKAQRFAAQVARTQEEERSKQRAHALSAAFFVMGLVAAGIAYFFFEAKGEVKRQLQSNELARAAFINRTKDRDLSLLLALQGVGWTAKDRTVTTFATVSLSRALQSMQVEVMPLDGTPLVAGGFCPDGRFLATVESGKQTAQVWDMTSGKKISTVNLQSVPQVLALGGEGRYLASAGQGRRRGEWEAEIWDVASRKMVMRMRHDEQITALAFSPSLPVVATASVDGKAMLWNLQSRKAVTLPHPGEVYDVAFSADGKRVATGSSDGAARVWDAVSGKQLGHQLKDGYSPVLGMAFSPDGRFLATASGDAERVAKLWNLENWSRVKVFQGHTGAVLRVVFSHDGELATVSDDHTVKLWDVHSGTASRRSINHPKQVLSLSFDRDRNRLLTASADGLVRTWPQPRKKTSVMDRIYGIAYTSDGKYLATANSGGTATLWDARSKEPLKTFAGHTDFVFGVAFSPDSKRLATASWDRTVKLWDTETAKEHPPALRHRDIVYQATFSKDGKRIATASRDGTVGIWEAATHRHLKSLLNPKGEVSDAVFSRDGRRLAAVGEEMAKIWDASTYRELLNLKGHERVFVHCVAFSEDGKRVATAGSDNVVRVFDAVTGERLTEIRGHTQMIWDVAFSPDGRYIATASWDMTARLWDATSGYEVMSLEEHSDRVYGVAFSPDGRHLATGSRDGTHHINIVDPQLLMGSARSLINRSLTDDECRKYLHQESGLSAMVAARSVHKEACPPAVKALALVAKGNHLIHYSDFRGAAAQFVKAQELDPSLQFDPDPDKTARKLVADPMRERAYRLAYAGDKASAVNLLLAAKRIDPDLAIDPDAFVRRATIARLIASSKATASTGKKEWLQEFIRMVQSKPELQSGAVPMDKLIALHLTAQGKEIGRAGNATEAAKKFKQAKELYPAIDLDPLHEKHHILATVAAEHGNRLANQGKVPEAMAEYRKAEGLDKDAISAVWWNTLCWAGTIWGKAADPQIKESCEHAVNLGYGNHNYRDSRGLNRALNGNAAGAIEDITAYLLQEKIEGQATSKELGKRELWIRRLRSGKPILANAAELDELRR